MMLHPAPSGDRDTFEEGAEFGRDNDFGQGTTLGPGSLVGKGGTFGADAVVGDDSVFLPGQTFAEGAHVACEAPSHPAAIPSFRASKPSLAPCLPFSLPRCPGLVHPMSYSAICDLVLR